MLAAWFLTYKRAKRKYTTMHYMHIIISLIKVYWHLCSGVLITSLGSTKQGKLQTITVNSGFYAAYLR